MPSVERVESEREEGERGRREEDPDGALGVVCACVREDLGLGAVCACSEENCHGVFRCLGHLGPLRIVKSPPPLYLLYLTFVINVIGSMRDEKVLPFEHRKRTHCFKLIRLHFSSCHCATRVSLTSSGTSVQLHMSEIS